MKVETIGKLLIAAGVIFLLYAMSMPVSLGDSGIINIHLISQRQNNLLFGGLLFLTGIILFAVFKLKQTKEESDDAEKLLQERTEKAKVLVGSTLQKSSEGASLAAKSVVEKMDHGKLSILIRAGTGIFIGLNIGQAVLHFVGWMLWLYTDNFIEPHGELLIVVAAVVVCTLYAFRKISTLKVLIHLVVGLVVLAMASALIGHSLQSAKREQCEKATFVSNICLEVLYGQKTR